MQLIGNVIGKILVDTLLFVALLYHCHVALRDSLVILPHHHSSSLKTKDLDPQQLKSMQLCYWPLDQSIG